MHELRTFFETCTAWPVFPASLLMAGVSLYWVLVILGALDIDVLDFDLDFDADADSILGLGWVGLRYLNLGEMPLIIWASAFALSWWGFAIAVEPPIAPTEWLPILWAVVRDVGVALIITKIITQPLRGRFEHKVPNPTEEIIGKTCTITTSTVTATFGQAEFKTSAAPLLLHVRSHAGPFAKGETAVIVDYDAENNTYDIAKVNSETE